MVMEKIIDNERFTLFFREYLSLNINDDKELAIGKEKHD